MLEKLKVIHLASEMAPYAKTGGLADVVAELPKALSSLGNIDCYAGIPKYGFIDGTNMYEMPFDVKFVMTGISYSVKIKYLKMNENLRMFFIEVKIFWEEIICMVMKTMVIALLSLLELLWRWQKP